MTCAINNWNFLGEIANFNLDGIISPVDPDILEYYLELSKYDEEETRFLVNGFRHGFDIYYDGPEDRQDRARNIPFQVGVGNKEEMWNKIMKEVEVGRFCGPFKEIPFDNFVQSPIGLVPKVGNKTRLIFHLWYDFPNGNKSINHHTPRERCTVKYNNIDFTIKLSLLMQKNRRISKIFYSNMDLMSAFRILPLKPSCSR